MTELIIFIVVLVLSLGQLLPLDWFRRLEQLDYRAHRASEARSRARHKRARYKRVKR